MEPLLNPSLLSVAAKTPLGTLGLMVVVLTLVALTFFVNASENIRLFVFLTMFAGVMSFGYSIISELKREWSTVPPKPNSVTTRTRL